MPIPILTSTSPGFARRFAGIRERGETADSAVEARVRRIVEAVRRGGDRALCAFTKRFDGVAVAPRDLRVTDAELDAAERALGAADRRALALAARRIAAFHRRQAQRSWSYRDGTGMALGQIVTPLRRVGVYVPGGRASYPSSVLMNVIPARVAGVREVIMVTPPGRDGIAPAVLAAARLARVSAVYRAGGAQAVAALAYGTETVPRADKIVGPGNAWVQAAKKLVYGAADIDKIAGPSEVAIIAGATAKPAYVAADLLAQAEHGSGDECVVVITPSRRLAAAVRAEIERQLRVLPRRGPIAAVLRRRAAIVVVRDLEEAVAVAEEVAPEHLELLVAGPRRWIGRIRSAGAIFVGPYSPAALGDYMAGPNHVLPTGGTARFFSPLGVYDFVKRTSLVHATRASLRRLAPATVRLASLEGYEAHANAVRCRFEDAPVSGGGGRQAARRGGGSRAAGAKKGGR